MGSHSPLDTLCEQHSELEQAITSEYERPAPNSLRLAELKREKLRLKDEIARINAG